MADDAAAPGARRPDLGTEEGRRKFIGILNSRLPKKRNIAQGLVRNERGEILLCELAYKKDWDLPGGVVDPSESPATCVRREISEELGVDWAVGDLRAVNWLPPYRGWDDAVLCLFDLGLVEPSLTEAQAKVLRDAIGVGQWTDLVTVASEVAFGKVVTPDFSASVSATLATGGSSPS